jgi:DNA-binding XRE family transcriptional regulator
VAGPSNDRRGRPVRAAQAALAPADLRARRVELGLTQAGLADLLGVDGETAWRVPSLWVAAADAALDPAR